jgi:serine protease Do
MRPFVLAGVLALGLLGRGAFRADEPKKEKPALVPPANTKTPETVDDLRTLERQVQGVVARVQPAIVAVLIGPAQGSGVLIKGGYVLTAGHVSGQPGRPVTLRLPDGKKLKGKTLGHNRDIDSGLIQVAEKGEWPTVEMGKASALKKGQWVVSIGHPGGFRPNRTPVVRLGRVLEVNPSVILTDCTLVGGDSGGPLFDLDGKVIGIHSRIGPSIAQNFHVPVDTYQATWDRLVKGEIWGGMAGVELVQSPGGKVVLEKKDRLTAADPKDTDRKSSHQKVYTFKMDPASIYTLDMTSKEMDSFLRLEDSAGKQLASDDDSGGNLDARIVFRPNKEDTYRIIVTTFQPNQTGAFTLKVRQLSLNDLLVQGNVKVFPALKMPRFVVPDLLKQLNANLGGVFVAGTVFDASGKPAANRDIQFQWDGGKTTLKTNDQGLVRLRLSPKSSRDLVLQVPAEHKALLELTDAAGKLRLFRYSDGPGRGRVPPPKDTVVVQEIEGKITNDEPFYLGRAGGKCRYKLHTFKVMPGTRYIFDLESTDFDAFLRIENSAGKQLAEDDDSAGDFNSRVVLNANKEDTLRIIVTTCDPGQRGDYRLTIRKAEKK